MMMMMMMVVAVVEMGGVLFYDIFVALANCADHPGSSLVSHP